MGLLDPDNEKEMEAIARYITSEPARTADARQIKDDFIIWYNKVGKSWYISESDLTEAKNRRKEFNFRNAVTTSEKETVTRVEKTGMTTEEAQGGVKTILSTGYREPIEAPWYESLLKNPFTTVGAIGAVVVLIGGVAYLMPTLITGAVLSKHYRR